MPNPLFSVVIPTRNRSDVLAQSIRCVLAQRHDDFEVVVSDNGSVDSTPDVVGSFDDKRIRYVRTPKMLHMPDSWEFALSHVSGRFVTFVSDDDGVTPKLLEMVERVLKQSGLEVVAWPFGGVYHHDTSEETALRNTLAFQRLDGRSTTVGAGEILGELSEVRFTHQLPRLINSCASRETLAAVKERFGRVFFPSCPDYSAGVAQLAVRPALAFVNELVLIWGVCGDSIGYSASKGSAASQTFFEELRKEKADRAEHVPLQVKSPMNYALDSALHIKSLSPGGLDRFEVKWKSYYMVVGQEMLALERHGIDMEGGFDELRRALRRESLLTRLSVAEKIMPFRRMAPLRLARARIGERLVAAKQLVKNQLRKPGQSLVRVAGREGRFANMFEAAARLEHLAAPRASAG